MNNNEFDDMMFIEGSKEGFDMLMRALDTETSLCRMDTHMKTDKNSYIEYVNKSDDEYNAYKKGYEEGYKAGFIQYARSKCHRNNRDAGGSDVKFGGF